VLEWLFLGGEPLPCEAAGDVNADGQLDVGDAIALLNYLFLGHEAPECPFPDCDATGRPSDLAIGCAEAPRACY